MKLTSPKAIAESTAGSRVRNATGPKRPKKVATQAVDAAVGAPVSKLVKN